MNQIVIGRNYSGLCALAAAFFIFSACEEKAQPAPAPIDVQVVSAVKADVPLYEEFTGQVYGQADVNIFSRVEGWVTSMHFKEGSLVKQGELLYIIDDVQYKAKVDQASGELARAKAEMVRTRNDLSRVEPLAAMNALSKKDLDNAKASYEASVAMVQAAQAALDNARIELGYTRVTAPFTGIIGISNVRPGDYVSRLGSNNILTTISSVGEVRIRFEISEKEYLRIARLAKDALDSAKKSVQIILADESVYPEYGIINFANRQIDPKTGTLTIEALFENKDGLLRPGLFVKTRVLMSSYPDAVIIPQSAVYQMQNIYQIFVLSEANELKANTVEVGPKSGDAWIITKGLESGQKVALVGNMSLQQGGAINPVEQKWPADKK